jgi:hypothetical protein
MTTVVREGRRACNARCYNGRRTKRCRCVYGGDFHGVGYDQAMAIADARKKQMSLFQDGEFALREWA